MPREIQPLLDMEPAQRLAHGLVLLLFPLFLRKIPLPVAFAELLSSAFNQAATLCGRQGGCKGNTLHFVSPLLSHSPHVQPLL